MSFVEIVVLINAIILFCWCVLFCLNIYWNIQDAKIEKNKKPKNVYSEDLLLLRILQNAEKIVKEKGVDILSAEDVFDIYSYLSLSGASEIEINESFKTFIDKKEDNEK